MGRFSTGPRQCSSISICLLMWMLRDELCSPWTNGCSRWIVLKRGGVLVLLLGLSHQLFPGPFSLAERSPCNCPTPRGRISKNNTMKRNAREFICSITTLLDHILETLTPEEQHDLLDAIAREVEERLDALLETAES